MAENIYGFQSYKVQLTINERGIRAFRVNDMVSKMRKADASLNPHTKRNEYDRISGLRLGIKRASDIGRPVYKCVV